MHINHRASSNPSIQSENKDRNQTNSPLHTIQSQLKTHTNNISAMPGYAATQLNKYNMHITWS